MVLKFHEKTAPISNGNYVIGAKSSICSPTFCRDVNDEKSFSKDSLSPLSKMLEAHYADSRSFFSKNEVINCGVCSAKSKKKAVRFMMDPCDSQKDHCLIYTTNEVLTPNDRRSRWYNSAEIKGMRNETYNEALNARSSELPYKQLFQQLLSLCEDTDADFSGRKHLSLTVAASQYRGLESLIFVETIRLNQRRTLQEILAAQEDFRDLLSSDELVLELQATSIKLSNCSSRLAQMLAVCDANEAWPVAIAQKISTTSAQNNQVKERHIQPIGVRPKTLGDYNESSTYEI